MPYAIRYAIRRLPALVVLAGAALGAVGAAQAALAPPTDRQVAGTEYTLAATCKPHDCADSNLVLLWAPKAAVLHGLVFQNGRNNLLGNPPPDVAKELQRLWAAEWRRGAGAK